MPDYPPGYDPSQADYISAQDQAIGGLIALGAFAAVSIGAFFTGAAVGAPIVASGMTNYGITAGQAMLMDLMASGEFSGQGLAVLELALEDAGITTGITTLDVGAIVAFGLTDSEAAAIVAINNHINASPGGYVGSFVPPNLFGSH